MSALDRWRERCAVEIQRPGDSGKLLAVGLRKALEWYQPTADAQEVAAHLEKWVELAAEGLRPSVSGLRLALTWLREEMAKDPDHA